MLLRLTPEFRGDRTIHGIIARNDTGSDILTLFDTGLLQLGNIQQYIGWQLPISIIDTNSGSTFFDRISVQVQLVQDDNPSGLTRLL